MITIGIDPGLSGALARLDDGVPTEWMVVPRHGGGKGDIDWLSVHRWLDEFAKDCTLLALEKVGAMPGQGVSSMFRFGGSYHGMRALIESLGIPHELVPPQRWKKSVLRDMDRADKRASGEYLRRRFPKHDFRATERSKKPHDGIADAVCLSLYAAQLLALR